MFSILMPAYNEELHIEEAIRSILNQSYQDIELLVVDDGSNDKTWSIITQLSQTDNRLKVFHPGKLGKNGATNYAKQHAKGEWFSFFGADDVMEPGILEKWYRITQNYNPLKDDIVISSRIKMFSTDKKYKSFDGIEIPKKKDDVVKSGAAFLATRKTMEELFPLPVDFPNEDGWMKLYFEYLVDEMVPCPETCINYRIHDGNSINKKAKFKDFNEKLHKRSIVTKTFAERYNDRLSSSAVEKLKRKYLLEYYRYNGKVLKIILMNHIEFSEKLRALFLSNFVLYGIKVSLSRVFLGRS